MKAMDGMDAINHDSDSERAGDYCSTPGQDSGQDSDVVLRDFSYEQCPAHERLLGGWLREAEEHEKACLASGTPCLRCLRGCLPVEIVLERDRLLHDTIERHELGLCSCPRGTAWACNTGPGAERRAVVEQAK